MTCLFRTISKQPSGMQEDAEHHLSQRTFTDDIIWIPYIMEAYSCESKLPANSC